MRTKVAIVALLSCASMQAQLSVLNGALGNISALDVVDASDVTLRSR